MILTGGDRSVGRKTSPSLHQYATNPAWTGLGLRLFSRPYLSRSFSIIKNDQDVTFRLHSSSFSFVCSTHPCEF